MSPQLLIKDAYKRGPMPVHLLIAAFNWLSFAASLSKLRSGRLRPVFVQKVFAAAAEYKTAASLFRLLRFAQPIEKCTGECTVWSPRLCPRKNFNLLEFVFVWPIRRHETWATRERTTTQPPAALPKRNLMTKKTTRKPMMRYAIADKTSIFSHVPTKLMYNWHQIGMQKN